MFSWRAFLSVEDYSAAEIGQFTVALRKRIAGFTDEIVNETAVRYRAGLSEKPYAAGFFIDNRSSAYEAVGAFAKLYARRGDKKHIRAVRSECRGKPFVSGDGSPGGFERKNSAFRVALFYVDWREAHQSGKRQHVRRKRRYASVYATTKRERVEACV